MIINAKIAWRNIWRNPRRSILTIMAIAFSCVLLIFSVSLQTGSYSTMINAAVKVNTGHIKIQKKGYNEDKKIRKFIKNPDPVLEKLKEIKDIQNFSCRANGFALVSSKNRTYGVSVVGIDPSSETKISTISEVIKKGHYLADNDSNQSLIGEKLAKNLNVDVGDELVLLGQGADGSVAANILIVKGIFKTGQQEVDRLVMQIPLSTFQETFMMDHAVHEIVVISKDIKRLPQLVKSIERKIEEFSGSQDLAVLPWQKLLPGLEQGIKLDMVSSGISYAILVMVVAFSIMNTFLMVILERTHEFGVLLAIGMKHKRIVRMVLLESVFMTTLGILFGIIAGCSITYYFQIYGIDFGNPDLFAQWGVPSVIKPELTWLSISSGSIFIFLVTLLVAIIPIHRLYKLKPADAMRAV